MYHVRYNYIGSVHIWQHSFKTWELRYDWIKTFEPFIENIQKSEG